MAKYRKRPVIVEAEQYLGEDTRGICFTLHTDAPGLAVRGIDRPHVHTIHEGQIAYVERGDWILPEPDGVHYYPCNPDIFEATYELVED